MRRPLICGYSCYSRGGVFLQCVLFNWLAFRSIAISSLWRNPLYFWSFYLPKLSIAMLIGSGVFLFKRKYWTIYVSALISIWTLAEMIYYRSTHIFIDAHSFLLIDNLRGFESSITMYMEWSYLLLLIPVALTAVGVWLFDNRRREWIALGISVLLSFALSAVGCLSIYSVHEQYAPKFSHKSVNPLSEDFVIPLFSNEMHLYAKEMSVVHCFFYDMKHLAQIPLEQRYKFTEKDAEDTAPFIQDRVAVTPKYPLVLVLVESLETWTVRPDITPNLYRFLKSHNVVWASTVKSQTKGGNSSDGQMIFNTGVLPLQQGAVCRRFPLVTLPSLSENYQHTAMIQPTDLLVWQQGTMNQIYHIDTAFVIPSALDHLTFCTLDSIATGQYDYILAITMATHTPFLSCSHYSSLSLPQDMPENMRNYLLCMNYTDSCWGSFLQRIDTDSVLHNSVVCFMGDHIIFDPIMRQEFQDYCDSKGLDFTPREGYTAFVGYSPELKQRVVIEEPTYQMDVYPTILSMIGAEEYYWKGFGVNLTDTAALHHRPITEQEAYMLSDKLIRANYFKEYVNRAE